MAMPLGSTPSSTGSDSAYSSSSSLDKAEKHKTPEKKGFFRGGFGTVQITQKDGVAVAVKRALTVDELSDRKDPKKSALHCLNILDREAKLLKELDHPHIVRYIKSSPGALVMAYAGISLEQLYSQFKLSSLDGTESPLDKQQLDKAIFQLASALDYLESCNVVHRDLTPANVLRSTEGHIKVTDFGESITLTAKEPNKDEKGKPEYRAPDWLTDEGWKPHSDLWSLGCIIYFLKTGKDLLYGMKDTRGFDILSHFKLNSEGNPSEKEGLQLIKDLDKLEFVLYKAVNAGTEQLKPEDKLYKDLIEMLVIFDPGNRFTPTEVSESLENGEVDLGSSDSEED